MSLTIDSQKCLKDLLKKGHVVRSDKYNVNINKIIDIMNKTPKIYNFNTKIEVLDVNILKKIYETKKLIKNEYWEIYDIVINNKFMFNKEAIYEYPYKNVISNGNIILTIYHDNKNELKNIINKIFFIVNVFRTLFNKDRNIKISIIYTDYKKEYNDNLDAKNINSGLCLSGEYIYIWRSEEIIKVLLHELGHFYEIEGITFKSDKLLSKLFDKDCEYKLQETYVEIVALIINICYAIHEFKYDNVINNYWSMIDYEYTFTLTQVNKIKQINPILDPCVLNKNTAIYAYYILKLMVIQNIRMFDIFKPSSIIICIYKTHQEGLILIPNNKSIFLNTTMRMTCIELVK